MRPYIIAAVVFVFVCVIRDFQVQVFDISCNRDTSYISIDFVSVQARDWYGSILFLEYHDGDFEWDFLFLKSKMRNARD